MTRSAAVPRSTKAVPEIAAYNLDQQIGFRLRLAMQRHTDIFFKNMVFGLTQPQFATLARLLASGACSQNDLGRSVALDSASMVGVVSRLKARKLVSVSKDKQDRRRAVINLTTTGRSVVRKAIAKGVLANDLTLAALSIENRKILIDLLKEVAAGDESSK
jgi:MarR family transcriptional regulator, lower aerobic nicotinate degradation pathway regulator